MNRRNFIQTSALAASAVIVPSAFAADGHVGKMSDAEFEKVTKAGVAKVAAIKPEAAPLSKEDEKLMMEVAMGGTMQLELSRAAVKQATSPDVKVYAHGEVEEQTGLSAKLKEIAAAKKMTMPPVDQEKIQKMVAKLQEKKGADFDKAYLKEGGVQGHELLLTTMERVESKAADATLKQVAATALPLIRAHLQAAKEEEAAAKA